MLSTLTTLGLGGPARRFVRIESINELRDVLATEDPVLILGGGSNLVVSDAGFDGLVIQLGLTGVTITPHGLVTAGAGVGWDDLVAQTIDAGLAGFECLSGIPGLVGATPMQNVGAYGQEVKDTIAEVRAWDRRARATVTLSAAECDFRYRESRLKDEAGRWVVLGVRFVLARSLQSAPIAYAELARALGVTEGQTAPLAQVRDTVIALRRGKGMVLDAADPESTSAGSFFMNPIVDDAMLAIVEERVRTRVASVKIPRFPGPPGRTKLPAAWLIERAGFAKGHGAGRVGISKKHTLALVNRGGGTTTELLALAREVRAGVHEAFGVTLQPEPVMIGCSL